MQISVTFTQNVVLFRGNMSLLSAQIVLGSSVILPRSIIGGYSENCSAGEFDEDLIRGELDSTFFNFPEKLNSSYSKDVGRIPLIVLCLHCAYLI